MSTRAPLLLIVLVILIGCESFNRSAIIAACASACAPQTPKVVAANGACECWPKPPEPPPLPPPPPDVDCISMDEAGCNAKKFCHGCGVTCGDAGVKRCSYGNDTWGAGPDVCECQVHSDGGER